MTKRRGESDESSRMARHGLNPPTRALSRMWGVGAIRQAAARDRGHAGGYRSPTMCYRPAHRRRPPHFKIYSSPREARAFAFWDERLAQVGQRISKTELGVFFVVIFGEDGPIASEAIFEPCAQIPTVDVKIFPFRGPRASRIPRRRLLEFWWSFQLPMTSRPSRRVRSLPMRSPGERLRSRPGRQHCCRTPRKCPRRWNWWRTVRVECQPSPAPITMPDGVMKS